MFAKGISRCHNLLQACKRLNEPEQLSSENIYFPTSCMQPAKAGETCRYIVLSEHSFLAYPKVPMSQKLAHLFYICAVTCDFQQCGILTSVD